MRTEASEIRVLLADDHQIVREGLRLLIEQQEQLHVIAEASDGVEAVRLAAESRPDVIIMDITMPRMNGIEATPRMLAASPDSEVIALSVHREKYYVCEMLKAGALGYVLKDSAFKELVQAIRVVGQGQTYVSSAIAEVLVDCVLDGVDADNRPAAASLTSRECQVLRLVAEGKSNKEIAAALGVAPRTVDAHRQHIMERLNLHTVAELTKFAIRQGLTSI